VETTPVRRPAPSVRLFVTQYRGPTVCQLFVKLAIQWFTNEFSSHPAELTFTPCSVKACDILKAADALCVYCAVRDDSLNVILAGFRR
jgi:hypothetical protein